MKKQIFFLTAIMALVSIGAFGQNAKKYYKAGLSLLKA